MAYQLWIEEPGRGRWHHATRRIRVGHYRAQCGTELGVRHAKVWPQKLDDPGPAIVDRCHECAGGEQLARSSSTEAASRRTD